MQRLVTLDAQNAKRSCPVYPPLGSARAQKEIVMAYLVHALLEKSFGKATVQQLPDYQPDILSKQLWEFLQAERQLLAEITACIPVVSPHGEVYTGP